MIPIWRVWVYIISFLAGMRTKLVRHKSIFTDPPVFFVRSNISFNIHGRSQALTSYVKFKFTRLLLLGLWMYEVTSSTQPSLINTKLSCVDGLVCTYICYKKQNWETAFWEVKISPDYTASHHSTEKFWVLFCAVPWMKWEGTVCL
jgi:hypothetical protein